MDKKSRILYIKRFLEEQTDEEHQATLADIITWLTAQGISGNRKTVAQDIELLIESGVDVVCNKSRQNQYFIGDRHFETPELKLMIDAAQASKFLTAKRSRTLIGKFMAFASRYQQEELKSGLYFGQQIKPGNESAYITADLLHKAITTGRRVRFMYIEYSPGKQKTYKHNRQVYELSPWAFVWNNDCYYVTGHSESHGKAVKFRVDRMAAAKLTDVPAVPAPEDFDLAAFVQATFQMFDGPMTDVTLRCENSLMKAIIDRFGEDVETTVIDKDHFSVTVRVSASKTFFGWVFASDGAVEIISPDETVAAYRGMLARAAKTFVALKP